MLKLQNIEKEKFDSFVKNHKTKSHFLQSLSWGELSKVKKNLTPYYLGLVDDENNIVAATLLLQKHLPMNECYFYAPRGFVIDFKKKELGFGPMFYPSGDYDEDWKQMEAFYRGINAKHPERYNLSN